MRLPISWIKESIPFEGTFQDLANRLTQLGLEVDGIESEKLSFSGVVVGEIEAVEPHPRADRLRIAVVFDGKARHQVVCGAPNCRPGLRSPFAPVGALLSSDGETFAIKAAKLRGVESFGMLASAQELGLGDENDGILELPQELIPGTPLEEVIQDASIEISLTPNLGHALSLLGVARELRASTSLPLYSPPIVSIEPLNQGSGLDLDLLVDKGVMSYYLRRFKLDKEAKSPLWLKRRLNLSGIGSNNLVVDVLNYVMIERGQPLHAFDAAQIEGGRLFVRWAKEGESFIALNEKEYSLKSHHLVIADEKGPLALAGVVGALRGSVTDKTEEVVVEAAQFDPRMIRKASRTLGLSTEASRRFERGIDPLGVEQGLNRALMLIEEMGGMKSSFHLIKGREAVFKHKQIDCRLSRIEEILGLKLSFDQVCSIWGRLDFVYSSDGKGTFHVVIPSFRNDLCLEIDLIEEVARVYGYDHIPKKNLSYTPSNLEHAPLFILEKKARQVLVALGLQEWMCCDLIDPRIVKEVLIHDELPGVPIPVLNPTSEEQSLLRPSLIPGLLQGMKRNLDKGCSSFQVFEVGNIHFKVQESFMEELTLGILLTGKADFDHWSERGRKVDFFDLKGILEAFLKRLGVGKPEFVAHNHPLFHPGRQAEILVKGRQIGVLGEIHPAIMKTFDLSERAIVLEISLHQLGSHINPQPRMTPLPEFPHMTRDWTVTLNEDIQVGHLLREIGDIDSPYLSEVTLKDLYQIEKKRNLTFRFIYRDLTKTLSQEIIDKEHGRMVAICESLIEKME